MCKNQTKLRIIENRLWATIATKQIGFQGFELVKPNSKTPNSNQMSIEH